MRPYVIHIIAFIGGRIDWANCTEKGLFVSKKDGRPTGKPSAHVAREAVGTPGLARNPLPLVWQIWSG